MYCQKVQDTYEGEENGNGNGGQTVTRSSQSNLCVV
jgi:hypothetical protein